MAHKTYSANEIAKALETSQGLISVAAEKLECSRDTVYRYIKKYKSVQKAIDDARESMLDKTEAKLWELIDEGNMSAISLYLKTIGKSRGYVERQELTGADGSPMKSEVSITTQENLEKKLDRLIGMRKNGFNGHNQSDSDDN